MNRRVLTFGKAIVKHWVILITGGLLIAILAIWQLTGHLVQPWIGWGIAVAAVVVACYKVWDEQQKALEEAQEPSKLVLTEIRWAQVGINGHGWEHPRKGKC